MRFRIALLVAVTSVLTVVSPASAGPTHTAGGDWAYVHRLLFEVPLSEFGATARTGADPWFDWSTDWCSAPLVGSTGLSFDFRWPCRRHDFGYRNLQLLERRYGTGRTYWNGANRQRVDDRFYADMKAHCRSRSVLLQPACYRWAWTFYSAVRVAGGP